MKHKHQDRTLLPCLILLAVLTLAFPMTVAAGVSGSYLYRLSNFTGIIPYSTPRIAVDKKRNETFVVYQNSISVFNENGMEVYRFGDDLELGHIVDLAVDGGGDLLVLSYKPVGPDVMAPEISLCNFRGEIKGIKKIKNLPASFGDFSPNRLIFHRGTIYLADLMRLTVILTDTDGSFQQGYDLFPLLDLGDDKKRTDVEMNGFSVDVDGGILFTIPTLFRAYRLSPQGMLSFFGKPGSAPGKFNIVGGIVSDSQGNYLVVDKLKCSILVFDRSFNYLSVIGQRGGKDGGLIAPDDIAIDRNDRVYVTQSASKGVNVYRLTYN